MAGQLPSLVKPWPQPRSGISVDILALAFKLSQKSYGTFTVHCQCANGCSVVSSQCALSMYRVCVATIYYMYSVAQTVMVNADLRSNFVCLSQDGLPSFQLTFMTIYITNKTCSLLGLIMKCLSACAFSLCCVQQIVAALVQL